MKRSCCQGGFYPILPYDEATTFLEIIGAKVVLVLLLLIS